MSDNAIRSVVILANALGIIINIAAIIGNATAHPRWAPLNALLAALNGFIIGDECRRR